MQKPLLILVTGDPVPSAHTRRGDFSVLIQEATEPAWPHGWSVIDLRNQSELPEPGDLAGVVVTGSPARLNEGTPWMQRGMEYLRRLVEVQTPTLGICFGHQMLGEALGGRVDANPRGREIGTVKLEARRAFPLLDELAGTNAEPVTANATHLDSIVELPPGAEVVATTELEPHAVVRFGRKAWGVQFHPEIDQEVMRCYLDERRDAIASEGIDVDELHGAATDAPHGRAVLRRFVERVVLSD